MYYHLRSHIYVAQFRDELILLDTKKDKYTICLKQFSDLLNNLFEENSFKQDTAKKEVYVQKLLNEHIIESKKVPYPFYIDRKPFSDGVSNVDWRLPLENSKINFDIQVLKALMTLIKVNFYIKVRGLHSAIQLIKKSYKSWESYVIPPDEELENLTNVLNKACFIYPQRTKCLEWAMTFVLLALQRKWKCNLEIGIQNYPFFAHAWVECDEKVVMDSQDLREGLAIILNEPFRRMKI